MRKEFRRPSIIQLPPIDEIRERVISHRDFTTAVVAAESEKRGIAPAKNIRENLDMLNAAVSYCESGAMLMDHTSVGLALKGTGVPLGHDTIDALHRLTTTMHLVCYDNALIQSIEERVKYNISAAEKLHQKSERSM